MRALLVFILTPLMSLYLHAQNWPVQVSAQLVPPFSGYLNDYASPNNDNLRFYLTLTDFSLPSYNVILKFKLTGNNITIQSKPFYYAGPFTLEPGVPLLITGTDLAGMLNQNNLDYSGITTQQYNQTKVLPEGFYTVSLIAYDFQNPLNVQVSNEATTQAWMMLCDPPLISLPLCGSEVTITNPQQLTFSWTPLNMSAPSSALGHEYLFELWEVMPPNNAPGNVVASTAPIYSTTTTLTILNYGIAEPPLQTGWTYVWRVRAYDLEGRELFRNNGYSQICTFTWGNNNNLLGNLANLTLTAQVLTHRQARCMWDSNAVYTSYHLEYRKVNTANWFPVNTTRANERITSLEPQTTYEAQVHGIFSNGDDGPWSNIVTFTTPAQALLNCGESSPPPSIQNFSPLTQATPGMLWQVGQFEMSVTALNNMSHANGLYSGMGKMIMPLGITLNCSFSNIQIGTDMVMYNGEVKAVTEGVGSWIDQYNASGFVQPEITYNGEINSPAEIVINPLAGTITIGSNSFEYEPGEGTAIEDQDGTIWIVTSTGQVILAGQTNVTFNPPPPNYINTTNGAVSFSPSTQQLYGYDHQTVQAWQGYYLSVTDIKDNSTKICDWKTVQTGKYDVLKVQYSALNGIHPDSIFFYNPSGTIYYAQGSGLNRQLYIAGGANKDRQDIYAAYRNSAREIINLGKICVTSFEEQSKTVILVPFASAQSATTAINNSYCLSIKQRLDSIYAGAVIKWDVQISPNALISSSWDSNNNGKISVASDGSSPYSTEMRSIISELKYEPWYNNNYNYLIVSSIQSDSALQGFQGTMPRGKNIGFLFSPPATTSFALTVAHELAHGVFSLEHSFEGTAPATKNSTDNLMDYSAGQRLCWWQWMWIHNPSGWSLFDQDADDNRVYVDMRELLPFLNSDSSSFTFMTPAGKPISIPKNGLSEVTFSYGDDWNPCADGSTFNSPVGSLSGFTLNDKKYKGTATCGSSTFNHYLCNAINSIYYDSISALINPAKSIIGYPCVSGGSIVFNVTQTTIASTTTYSNQYCGSGTFVNHILVWDGFAQNVASTQINANISPPYNEYAESYLVNNLGAAGCGEVGTSYVLTYAYQIQKYPETYECCFEQSDNSSTYNINSLQPPPSNAYNTIPTTTPLIQKEQQIRQLQNLAKTRFEATDKKRNSINSELMSIQSPTVMADSLNNIPAPICIWNAIHAKTRIHCISVLAQSTNPNDWSSIGGNYEKLLNDLFATTTDVLQQDSLLNALSNNNSALLSAFWQLLDTDGLDEFINTITGWLATSPNHQRPSFESLAPQAFIYVPGNQPNLPVRYFEFYKYRDNQSLSSFEFTSSHSWTNGNIYLHTFYDPIKTDAVAGINTETTLPAFDWVAIKIMEDIPSLGLKQNQQLVVPMIWAKWLSQRIFTNEISEALDLIAQVTLFLATDYVGNMIFEGLFVAVNSSATLTPRIMGQDIRAIAATPTKTSEVALDMELGVDGVWTWKGVKWEPVYNPNAPVLGRVPGCKFTTPQGQVVQRELLIVETAETICVRDATTVLLSNPFTIGQEIAGKTIVRLRNGTIPKIAIIGRKMSGHVIDMGNTLGALGFDVELFGGATNLEAKLFKDQLESTFLIENVEYTWSQIEMDFVNGTYVRDPVTNWIVDSDLPNTLMYKANQQWAEKIKREGYTVIDIGYPPNTNPTQSVFYNMEINTIFTQ